MHAELRLFCLMASTHNAYRFASNLEHYSVMLMLPQLTARFPYLLQGLLKGFLCSQMLSLLVSVLVCL